MHKSTRFLIVFIIAILCGSFLTACTNTPSVEQYSKDLDVLLEKYNTWSTGILSVYHSMLESYTVYDPTLTYGDLIMGTLYSYQGGNGVSPSQSWNPLDVDIFQGTVQMLYDDAKEIMDLMNTMNPPEEVAEAHQKLYGCMEYHANIAATMLLVFTEDSYEQLNYMSNPCDDLEPALLTLTQFLQQNPAQ